MAQKYKGKELYPNLFSPIRIGNVRLKNRIIAAPTSPSMIDSEGHMTPEMVAYLEDRAAGGAAVVTYGEAIPHSATGKSHNKQLQLDSFGVRQGLTESTRAIHNVGALANIQLSHGGMYGGLSSVGGDVGCCEVAYGPSAVQMPAGEVKVRHIDELKLVYQGQDITPYEALPAHHFFLQPCSGLNIRETIDCILAHPRWRLSLQTHKMVGIR